MTHDQPEPLSLQNVAPRGRFSEPRTVVSLVLVAAALGLMLISAVTGYLDYTSPLAVSIRSMVAESGQQLEADMAAQGVVTDVEQPFDAGIVGAVLWRDSTLLALLCLVGAWAVMVTRPPREGVSVPSESLPDDAREPVQADSDAGPYFD